MGGVAKINTPTKAKLPMTLPFINILKKKQKTKCTKNINEHIYGLLLFFGIKIQLSCN